MYTNLQDYLKREGSNFKFVIKTVYDLEKDDSEKKLESLFVFLQKYNLKEKPIISKTPVQKNPLDFPSHPNSAVWIIKVVLGMPVSPYVLTKEIVSLWEITESAVVVKNYFEPSEKYNMEEESKKELEEKLKEKNLKRSSLLSTKETDYNREETRGENFEYFGNLFNELFKNSLNKNRKNPYPQFELSYEKEENKLFMNNDKNNSSVFYFGREISEKNTTQPLSRWGNFWHDIVNYYTPFEEKDKKEKKALSSSYKNLKEKKD